MSERSSPLTVRTGLPSPITVLSEALLRPPKGGAPATAGVEASPAISYRILRTNQVDAYDDPVAEMDIPAIGLAFAAGDAFRGTARKAAKISISPAATEVFTDLAELIASLPAEDLLTDHDPEIGKGADADRVALEHRNVRVRAFLYAASREDDNDYHLIIGRELSASPIYMTMEISGLPPESSLHFRRLQAARDAVKTFFGTMLPGTSYDFYDPPIELDVEGSLFFDISHAMGSRPGPQDLRPHMPVVWEVHPISMIVLEPKGVVDGPQ